jgi:hypothetical protein
MSISNGEVIIRDDECKPVMTLNTLNPTAAPKTTRMAASSVTAREAGGAVTGSCRSAGEWGQCGGKSCPGDYGLAADKCTDAPYQGFCCPAGWNCMRQHEW